MAQANYKNGSPLFKGYTPGAAVDAGDIVVQGRKCYVAHSAIAASAVGNISVPNGNVIYQLPKDDTSGPVFAVGDNVYWDATNELAVKTALGNTFFGIAAAAAGTSDAYVDVLHGAKEEGQVDTVASAGSTTSDAAALTGRINTVTGADGTKGVKIVNAGTAGDVIEVYNAVATNGLKIYPPTGDTLNGGSADAALTIEGKTLAKLTCIDGDNWAVIFTANT